MRITENTFYVLVCMSESYLGYGYEIKKRIKEISYDKRDVSTSTIYSILAKLMEHDYIKVCNIVSTKSVIYYAITPKGEELLKQEIEKMKYLLTITKKESH